MKKTISVLLGAFLAMSGPAANAATPDDFVGNWKGTIELGAVKLRLVFKVGKTADGLLMARMDSADQGLREVPVNTITVKDDALKLEVQRVQGIYEGTADVGMTRITGRWQQGRQSLPLMLERMEGTNLLAGLDNFSPADEEANMEAAIKLPGTWSGTLAMVPTSIGITVKITKAPGGAATGTVDSPQQRVAGYALSALTYRDGAVHFDATGMGASFQANLEADGSTLRGQWHQSGQTLPLELRKAAPLAPPGRLAPAQ